MSNLERLTESRDRALQVLPGYLFVAWLLLIISLTSGCTTPYVQGRAALRQGRYYEAASHFQQALAQNPDRADALIGLGVSRYKMSAFDEAVEALGRVVVHYPKRREARLYLGLSYLRKGEIGPAEEQLAALAALKPHPRLVAQMDRALRLLRVEYPPSEELRAFIAASLEDELEWEREVREAEVTRPVYVEPFWRFGLVRCFQDRLGRLICL
ncbi:MAG: tetratricopeptide repeat protein [Candidatus Rokubacteria bacterium]|nr:tetratricopeptide repeat protein [Candidatus Rokubacteria bacterium]MBI2543909.1 tetratricopeptide repeat protein [Candidatus Rokubacteria bacterium]MBI2554710.1 tetratricopeptide repeat protein [Candidatus Rokubacteria bacterium]